MIDKHSIHLEISGLSQDAFFFLEHLPLASLCWLVELDKYARETLSDRNTGDLPASPGFLDRFTPGESGISALLLRV